MDQKECTDICSAGSPALSAPATPKESQIPGSPTAFTISNDEDLANTNGNTDAPTDEDGPSAADYDPTMDMKDDRNRDDQRHGDELSSATYDETNLPAERQILIPETSILESKESNGFDMFADDDDMFAEDNEDNTHEVTKHIGIEGSSKAVPVSEGKTLDIGMLDNWDDPEGYYKIILGELLEGRYKVMTNLGKGMFSGVVRALDTQTQKLVAIKLIRNNETM